MLLFTSFLAPKGRQTTGGGVGPRKGVNPVNGKIDTVTSPEGATDHKRGCKPPYGCKPRKRQNRHSYQP